MIMSILLLNKNSRDVKKNTFFQYILKLLILHKMSKSCMSCTFRTGKLCYNGSYRNERRLLSMNSPFWSLVMRYFLEFFPWCPVRFSAFFRFRTGSA